MHLLIPQPPQQQQRYSITVAGLGLEMCPMCLEPSVSFIIIVIFLFSTNSFFKIRMIYNKNNKRNLNTFINNHRKASTSPRPIPLRLMIALACCWWTRAVWRDLFLSRSEGEGRDWLETWMNLELQVCFFVIFYFLLLCIQHTEPKTTARTNGHQATTSHRGSLV